MSALLIVITLAAAPLSDAERLFEEGRLALKAGAPDTACPKFEKSHQLVPALGTLLNWAACLEASGKTASAFVRFNEAAAWASRTGERTREAFAQTRAAKLRPQLSWLVLKLEPFREGGEATVNGVTVALLTDTTAVAVDPGLVELATSVPGVPRFASTERAPAAGDRLEVRVPSTVAVPVVEAPPPMPALTPTTVKPVVISTQVDLAPPVKGPTAALIASGLVLVSAVVALVWSVDVANQLRAQQATGRLTVTRSQYDVLQTLYPTSLVGLGLGVVGLVTSSIALRAALKPRVAFWLSPELTSVALSWSLP